MIALRLLSRRRLVAAALCPLFMTSGCAWFGPHLLRTDQVDYERALGDAKKREMLATVVGLRFGDSPSFVAVSQIIASYTFEASAGVLAEGGSSAAGTSFGQASAGASYSNHPTFTFVPTTGEALATGYIRPLPTELLLPLADSGVPIDLLLRLSVQSIGGLQNAAPLGGPESDGNPGFFALLRALRRLQLAGQLTVNYKQAAPDHPARVTMTLGSDDAPPGTATDLAEVRRLLRLSPAVREYAVVYGPASGNGRAINMVTRSVMGILTNLGAQISVPEDDVKRGATVPTVHLVGGETRPTIVVHVDKKPPPDAYAAVVYHDATFWIDNDDFDSKYALTVLQNVIALAQANQDQKAPILTVPAG
ncbi:hypothetical protein LMG28688_03563 [Paraburkholderia caffeinitolerans]|uniref:Uncharacterized protein n=1 Tax=Paraburkholderia caffeinitolerans TaxID=1723730 RepID=A0A6J5G4C1_9BURK|nr:hypothetical protein [Paraburkholderia caffeinitolerans]CAB3792622.1 hypothetical protein LMG28688_03563 [Paraburkholderia caffeinitolerans]